MNEELKKDLPVKSLIYYLRIFFKFFPYLFSFVALYFSIYTYYQVLPLKQSNVIFSEENIKISQIQNATTTNDIIEPIIENIGEATAKNIKFRIYLTPFKSDGQVEKVFDDMLMNELPTHTKMQFGQINVSHLGKGDILQAGKVAVLIYDLEYTDSLTNKTIKRRFMFQYTIGASKMRSLIQSDYKKYEKIEEQIKSLSL